MFSEYEIEMKLQLEDWINIIDSRKEKNQSFTRIMDANFKQIGF